MATDNPDRHVRRMIRLQPHAREGIADPALQLILGESLPRAHAFPQRPPKIINPDE